MTEPWRDPAVLVANLDVALEALDRMIGLEDSKPVSIQYELAHDCLKGLRADTVGSLFETTEEAEEREARTSRPPESTVTMHDLRRAYDG